MWGKQKMNPDKLSSISNLQKFLVFKNPPPPLSHYKAVSVFRGKIEEQASLWACDAFFGIFLLK